MRIVDRELGFRIFIYFLFFAFVQGRINDFREDSECPEGCLCEEEDTLFCNNLDISRVPNFWPTHYRRIILRNSSLTTLHKNSFRKFKFLEELKIEENFQLDVIDKYAFKGLQKLRFLSLTKNPKLAQIYKSTFSGIGNEQSLKIHLKQNGLQQIGPYSFKNLNNVRELSIEDECIFLQSNSLSSISVLDFVFITGACSLSPETFSNTTRVHNLHISKSKFNLTTRAFAGLSHVNHILIQNNQIPEIFEDTFGGSSTIGNIQIQTNKIGNLNPRAFVSTENLGTVVFTQNVIENPLSSPECILNDAQRFVFADNTVFCGCPMKWIQYYTDRMFLKENFCGREEAFKSLIYFEPQNCPTERLPVVRTTTPPEPVPEPYFPSNSGGTLTSKVSLLIFTFAQVSFRSIFI